MPKVNTEAKVDIEAKVDNEAKVSIEGLPSYRYVLFLTLTSESELESE